MTIHKIDVYVKTIYVGSEETETIEVSAPDECSPEELAQIKEDAAREWMFDNSEWGWKDSE